MPKTLAALPSNQYATILSLIFGKLDLLEAATLSAALAADDVEVNLFEVEVKDRFDVVLKMGELAFRRNGGAVERLKKGVVA